MSYERGDKVTKVKALVRYELTNIKRGKLIWVIAILYAFGIEQSISSMFTYGNNAVSLVELIKHSWVPINFIMIPLMIMAMMVGESDDEIFKVMDISPLETILSKLLTLAIVDVVILAANIIIAVVIALICKVSIGYFFYQMLGYVVNTIVSLVVCSLLGLFIGQVLIKKVGAVVSLVVNIVIFIILSNFYKLHNVIFPLFDIRNSAGSFDVISYDKSYLYHNVFWLIISIILIITMYELSFGKVESKRSRMLRTGIIICSIAVCAYLGIGIYSLKPTFYENEAVQKVEAGGFDNKNKVSFSKSDSDYYIEKYKMNINIDNEFKNNCSMNVMINQNNIDSIKLALYEGLKISNIKVDEKQCSFDRKENSFVIKLPKQYSKGDKININLQYSGFINTTWRNGEELFFARSNAFFLAHTFEWYPKQSDEYLKDYEIELMHSGKNKVYSNLDNQSQSPKYKLSGKAKEIFIICGHIEERKYKGYTFVGNEELINNDKYCEQIIKELKNNNIDGIEKVIFSPFVPYKMITKDYGSSFMTSMGDF